ncbi:Arm DNA-binding domain-containing protein [uncultured Enterobacter sp.]|uniref:Arm DNA-binding domain-containing protein n=1 Tax=uncultured Enterobacter sp. TaxID=238202 RepID=UPI002604D95E|nr:Arm DNA-binding domain-containing protein [uncultured Enterobacter sp.]
MFPESDEYYNGFPHAISSENEENTSFTDYNLFYTLAECLYHGISREIFDGSEPALRAVIANGEIKFLARYTLGGACYYEPLGRFPRMSIKDARERARELYNSHDDNRVPDEEYGAAYNEIPF